MKNLLLVLSLLLPVLVYSQDSIKTQKHEVGISAGPSFFLPKNNGYAPEPLLAITYLHNIKKEYQLGLTIEAAALNNGNYNYLIPAIIANRKLNTNKSYWYAGVTAGAFIGRNTLFNVGHTGMVLGVQGGYVLHISNRFAFTSQIGVRAVYVFRYGNNTINSNELIPHIPITIGLRYRF